MKMTDQQWEDEMIEMVYRHGKKFRPRNASCVCKDRRPGKKESSNLSALLFCVIVAAVFAASVIYSL